MTEDSSTDLSAVKTENVSKLWATAQSISKAPTYMRIVAGNTGAVVAWYVFPPEGTFQILILGASVFLSVIGLHALGEKAHAAWVARPVYRFKIMADRVERLAGELSNRASRPYLDRKSLLQEMGKLRSDLTLLEVYIHVESSSLYSDPGSVIAACQADKKTLRGLAELMRAGDLKTARVEFPKV